MSKPVHRLRDKNLAAFTANCLECGPVTMRYRKDRNSHFCPNSSSAKGYGSGGRRVRRPTAVVAAARQEFMVKQGGCCAICGKPDRDLDRAFALDHCHKSGELRGILCRNCNVGLGNFKDDPALLTRAIEYLAL